MNDYLVCIVHYNNSDEVTRFCKMAKRLRLENIAICDNSLNIPSNSEIYTYASVFSASKNMGYLNGCAFALKQYRSQHPDFSGHVIVSNTDVEYKDDFCSRLSEHTEIEGVGCVAPNIQLESGFQQNPHIISRLSPEKIDQLRLIYSSKWIGAIYLLLATAKQKLRRIERDTNLRPIYGPHGACVVLTKAYFDKGGVLEYGGFLYDEEIHIAEQLRLAGLKTLYVPSVEITHRQHSSTQLVRKIQQVSWHRQSMNWIKQNYYKTQ